MFVKFINPKFALLFALSHVSLFYIPKISAAPAFITCPAKGTIQCMDDPGLMDTVEFNKRMREVKKKRLPDINLARPMRHVKIELRDGRRVLQTGKTDENGNFAMDLPIVTKSGICTSVRQYTKDISLHVVYLYEGVYGSFSLDKDPFGATTDMLAESHIFDSEQQAVVDFNTNPGADVQVTLDDRNCRGYLRFYDALKDFYERSHFPLPYKRLSVRMQGLDIFKVFGGWALRSEVRISPRLEEVDIYTAKHEFGHTIRHTLDGNIFHLGKDVWQYKYIQAHDCEFVTNEGFAFNEGWAEFIADDCKTGENKNKYYGDRPDDYAIEGNVAMALRNLQNLCHNSLDALRDMIEVLIQNPGTIHSYAEFEERHKQIFNCP